MDPTLLILLLMSVPTLVGRLYDPAPGLFQSRADARNLDCVRLSQEKAHELFPGRVAEPPSRSSGQTITDALACQRRFLDYGERPDRDELILSTLRLTVGEITGIASATGSSGTTGTWYVDAFYPEPRVAAKISVAAKTDLAERGQRVSDRVPVLAAGDIAVLGGMAPKQAYPLACARYFEQKLLTGDDVFLGLMIVDAREAQLHAGLCSRGVWKWIQ